MTASANTNEDIIIMCILLPDYVLLSVYSPYNT